MSPNLLAFIASLVFGVVVFPWAASLKRLGPAEFFLVTGTTYVITGVVLRQTASQHPRWTMEALGLSVLTAVLYVVAVLCVIYALRHPRVNLPIVAAITAAYPAWTAVITVATGKRLTVSEGIFLLLTFIGLAGLGLLSKPPDP